MVTEPNKTWVQSYIATKKIKYYCSTATKNTLMQNENKSIFQGILGTYEPEPQQESRLTQLLFLSELRTADLTLKQWSFSTYLQSSLMISIFIQHKVFPETC